MLKIDHVTKRFGSFTAVNDLTLEIPDKQMFGLLGANGAGKTTTFRMILGLLNATEVLSHGKDSRLTTVSQTASAICPKSADCTRS